MLKKVISLSFIFLIFVSFLWADTKPPLGSQINWAYPLADGLVGCWLMNENGGDKVYDLSGNGNTGTLTNMVPADDWVPGRTGCTLNFDGTDAYLTTGLTQTLDALEGTPGTISLWVNSDVALNSTGDYGLIDSAPAQLGALQIQAYGVSGASKLRLSLGGDSGAEMAFDGSWIGEWHHIAGTWNKGSAPTMKLYVDGVFKVQYGTGRSVRVDTFKIGVLNTLYWDGLIDDVRVWNRLLTAQEVQQLFLDQYQIFDFPNLTLFYQEAITSRVIIIQ